MALPDIMPAATDLANVHIAQIRNELERLVSPVNYKRKDTKPNLESPVEQDIGTTVQEIAFLMGQLQQDGVCVQSGLWVMNVAKRAALVAALQGEMAILQLQLRKFNQRPPLAQMAAA